MVDAHLGTRLGDSIQKALRSYTVEFKKKAQAEKERYIGLIEKSVKDIINDEPQSTYEAASSLTEFELKKILIDKMEMSQSNLTVDEHKELYKALVNPYNIDKDLFLVYGKAVSLKRGREDKDKDEGPPARSDQEMKRRKTRKDVESLKGQDMGNTDDQPNVEAAPKYDWFKKPERPPTPDSDWNVRKSVDFRPPQTWISKIAQAEKPPLSFDELMSTPIDFSAYVMNHLKIDNLTQDHLVGPAFNLLNGTCKSLVELEYNIEECYKAVTNRLDWNNPKGKKYPFDLSKPLSLIMDRGRQVVPVDYFINNNLEYLRGGSSSRKYTTSTTKTKAAKYDIQGIRDMVPSLWSPVKPQEAKRSSFDGNYDVVAPAYGKVQTKRNKDKGKKFAKHSQIQGIRFTKPKTKLVYRDVQKMPNDDQTKTDSVKSHEDTNNVKSPIDSTGPGFHSDDIDLGELKRFVDQRMEEDKILDINSNSGNNGCISECMDDNIAASKVSTSSVNSGTRCDADAKDSFGKSSYTMEVMNADSETDEDVVSLPDARSSRPSTSFGGGHQLEKEAFNFQDEFIDQIEDYPGMFQEFSDQIDFHLLGCGRKNTYTDHHRCDADAKDSFGKSSYTMEVMNADSETDEDVVSLPDARSSRPSTSFGGGHQLEKEAFNFQDEFIVQIEDYPGMFQEFSDQFDFHLLGCGRK
ncbi:hypothetical protein Tco_0567143 [Tanacetum coccineum]